MDQPHLVYPYAKNLMCDLGQRGFQALPMRVGTDAQFQSTVWCQTSGTLLVTRDHRDSPAGVDRCAVRALLRIHCKADSDVTSIGFTATLAFTDGGKIDGLDCTA